MTTTPSTRSRSLRYSVAGLFSGVGGLELGLEQAGHETVFQCENDPQALAVLRERFKGCKRRTDINSLTSLPSADVLAAGFPCQDLSQAGRTTGIGGNRSGLIDRVFDLLAKKRHCPQWVVLENVPFMLQLGRGAAMNHLTDRLGALGYRWAYRVVDTRSFGLPQRRRRVLLLASQTFDPRQVLFADDLGAAPSLRRSSTACGFYWTEGNRGLGWTPNGVPTLKGGSGLGIPSPPAIWCRRTNDVVTPDIRDAERLQGLPANWTKPAERIGRAGARWKLVGNAVSVPVANWLGQRLGKPGDYCHVSDEPLQPGASWPNAAWGDEYGSFTSTVSEWPKDSPYSHLHEFLRFPTKPLSLRAARGFLQRARASSLRFEPGFLDAIDAHISTTSRVSPALT